MQVACAIVVNEQGQVLLAERPPHKSFAGLWEFPGGKIEPGEGAEQALLRELKEELVLAVKIDRKLGQFDFEYEWGSVTLHVMICTPLNLPQPTSDVHQFRWVQPSAVEPTELTPADAAPWERFLHESLAKTRT
jgi:mutator protein MutT